MISRDRYDVVESHINDRSLFSHLALGLATFGLSVGVERGIQFWEERDQVSLALLVVCTFCIVLSLVFWRISNDRKGKIASARQALFDRSRVVSDEVTFVTSDGTQTVQQAITSSAKRDRKVAIVSMSLLKRIDQFLEVEAEEEAKAAQHALEEFQSEGGKTMDQIKQELGMD